MTDPLRDPVTRDDWYDTEPGLFDLADHHYDIAKDQDHQ